MIYKTRSESAELLILGALNKRMSLMEKGKQHYLVLRKGYEGEVLFDSMTEKHRVSVFDFERFITKN